MRCPAPTLAIVLSAATVAGLPGTPAARIGGPDLLPDRNNELGGPQTVQAADAIEENGGLSAGLRLADAALDDRKTPFGNTIRAAADGDGELSLLLFRLESKPLRIGSSLADADDSVLLVEAILGPPANKLAAAAVLPTVPVQARKASVVAVLPTAVEQPQGDTPSQTPGVLTWVGAGGLVVVVVVAVWWRGWWPASTPVDPLTSGK